MSDYSELKRSAEAAPGGPWVAENDSLYFKDDGYTRHLMDADAGHDVEDEAYYSALKFIAAANPDAVLALIAENDRLERETNRVNASWHGMKRDLDQLKAENESLRREKSEPCDGCFMADAEALRKDAERYQWVVDNQVLARSFLVTELGQGIYTKSKVWEINRDIDAAMGNGEK